MRFLTFLSCLLMAAFASGAACANPVLMISIDGLRPADIIDAKARGLNVPNLYGFVAHGAYATGVKNMLPSVTYPNHTTLITGVAPALHGVTNNTVFDPLKKNYDGWYWYSVDIKVPTLWDAVHAQHKVVASIDWPVSVGNPSIDDNIPEYWRAETPEDLKLIDALSTPGLNQELARKAGISPATLFGEDPASDTARAKFAAALIELKHPEFMTLHLVSLDGNQHEYGPGTPKAHEALETIDAAVGNLIAAARKAEPDLAVVIVSDHGFASIQHDVNLMSAFADAGLVTVDPATHKITAWKAEPWGAGGSAAIMLADPRDGATKAKVSTLLRKLSHDPSSGIAQVIDRNEIAKMGGGTEPSFWVDFKIGYEMGNKMSGPLVTAGSIKGTHGYFPTHKEMRATFMIEGPGIAKKGSLGEIDMRDIAPTVAGILGVKLIQATGKPLF